MFKCFGNGIIIFQLMVDGVTLRIGQSAQLLVEEEPRLGPEPALTLPLLTVELFARDQALKLIIATH